MADIEPLATPEPEPFAQKFGHLLSGGADQLPSIRVLEFLARESVPEAALTLCWCWPVLVLARARTRMWCVSTPADVSAAHTMRGSGQCASGE